MCDRYWFGRGQTGGKGARIYLDDAYGGTSDRAMQILDGE